MKSSERSRDTNLVASFALRSILLLTISCKVLFSSIVAKPESMCRFTNYPPSNVPEADRRPASRCREGHRITPRRWAGQPFDPGSLAANHRQALFDVRHRALCPHP